MSIDLGGVNYLAVVVAALATFLIGALWYTALFGKLWKQMHGYTEEKIKEMHTKRPMPVFFAGLLASYLVVAWTMAVLLSSFQVESALVGAGAGLLIWLGPAAAIHMTGHLSSDRRFGVYWIDTGYQLIYLVMMGAILGAWR